MHHKSLILASFGKAAQQQRKVADLNLAILYLTMQMSDARKRSVATGGNWREVHVRRHLRPSAISLLPSISYPS